MIEINSVDHSIDLDDLKFYVSTNNVILSPGNDDGIIPIQYFRLVENRQGEQLWPLADSFKKTSSDS